MGRMGEAHGLFSPTHPDTQAPADGADPSDGQVATWSTALGAWIAADPAGGVTDHGALTGLVPDDDHTQYALADKSRPSPWVSAANLSVRSLADLGTKAHDLLTGRDDDDHSIYALLAGRSGGQSFIAGVGAGDHLTLQSTAHATRGYVRAQDDLQLLSNIIRDSGGNARIGLDTSSPEVSLTGGVDVSGHLGVGSGGVVHAGKVINAVGTLAIHPARAIYASVVGNLLIGSQLTYGVFGGAEGQGTPAYAVVMGLNFYAKHNTTSQCFYLTGISVQILSGASGSGPITLARAFHATPAYWANAKPATVRGMDIEEQGGAGVGTAEGLKIADQTATTVRLLELGPAVPYLRLVGGADPAANQSNLYLKLGSTLKQVIEYDADSAGVGYRALRVLN